MALTKEQFTELYNKGLSIEQIQAFEAGKKPSDLQPTQPQNKSFLRSLVEDPFKTLLVTPAARTAEAVGRTGILGQNIKRGYEEMIGQPQTFGGITVEPQKAFGEGGGRQILGEAAKTASYLYTGGGTPSAVSTGLKGQVLQGAKEGFKLGATGGGLYSFGEAVQQAENQPADIAYQTLFGTVAGGVTGGILGAATPVVVKTAGKIKEYTNLEKIQEKLYTANKDILKPTSTQLKDWKNEKVDPIKTFVQEFGPENIPHSGDKLQLDNLIEQVDTRYKVGSQGFNTILRNSPQTTSLSQAGQEAIDRINKSSLIPSAKKTAIRRIQNEIPYLIEEARNAGVLIDNDRVPVAYTDNLKDRFWGATKNFGPEEAGIANETNLAFGRSFAKQIEDSIDDFNVKQYNKKLQELITLKDFLESRNGKVPGTGGKMARYTARIIGGSAGFGSGPAGSVVGSVTADKIAQALINPNTQTWILRKQLQKLSPEVRESLQKEAEQIILNMAQRRAETLRLPAPTTIYVPPRGTPNSAGFTTTPVVETMSNLPNSGGYISRQTLNTGAGASAGATAGFETDQQGNVTYNVPKGLAGALIGGTIGAKGKIGLSIKDVTKDIPSVYKGEKDLTTKILKDLEGKSTVSKQYILDATNRPELKQVERDLIRRILDDMDNVGSDPLITEAKKYKSAEEFVNKSLSSKLVKATPTNYGETKTYKILEKYSANKQDIVMPKDSVVFRGGKDGVYYSADLGTAEGYAGSNPVIAIDISGKKLANFNKFSGGKFASDPDIDLNSIIKKALDDGYDGLYSKDNYGEVILPTKSQLTDIWNKAKSSDTINVSDFAKKVKAELLPLKVKGSDTVNPKFDQYSSRYMQNEGSFSTKYDNIALPDELRGNVANYKENIYESPIATSAGDTHFGYTTKNYFGHTRIEDMADNKTRRVIEVQSDLYQKGNLEREMPQIGTGANRKGAEEIAKQDPNSFAGKQLAREKEVAKLQQYNDPTAHFRMVREEIKKASQDGKTKLQFPTGETAMKIEGLGQEDVWQTFNKGVEDGYWLGRKNLELDDLKVGREIGRNEENWIITDVLGDGKFKAVPKETVDLRGLEAARNHALVETFDISGKVDTNNPIYKFYEKDVAKYLNKFGGKRIIDDKGVSWIEVPITKEQGKMPVEAFGMVGLLGLGTTTDMSKASQTPQELSKNKAYIDSIAEAIAFNETGGVKTNPYSFSKFSGDKKMGNDLGRYQITSALLKQHSKRYLGREVSEKEFLASPELQDTFIKNRIAYQLSQGYSPEQIADFHRGGTGNIKPPGEYKIRNKQYVDNFLKTLNKNKVK